jgi:diguanylate cyclase (GGDEF)-like protein/PAS domain S-box-containing protein
VQASLIPPSRILYAEGEKCDLEGLKRFLGAAYDDFSVTPVRTLEALLDALQKESYDLVIAELDLPGAVGFELIEAVKRRYPDLPLVIMTADKDRALAAVRLGVADCLSKTPQQLARLPHILRGALERKRLELEKRQIEDRLRMVTRARAVMAQCNRVLVRATDEGQLLADMCRIVVEAGGYRTAWIGMARHDEVKTLEPVAMVGAHVDHLSVSKISWGTTEAGQGPAGVAVRSRKPQAARNVQTDPFFSRWRQQVLVHGFEAVAALPLVIDDEAVGVLGILAAEPDAFDAEELTLLDELAHDIAYGIGHLRLRAVQARSEQLLRIEHTVTRCLAEADTGAAMKTIMRTVCETQGWDCARYFRADEQAGVLRYGDGWGVASPGIQAFLERSRSVMYGPGVGLMGRVWDSGEPLWIADLDADPRATRSAYTVESSIRAAFIFPLKSEGRTIGVLGFASREIREPDERLQQAVRVIGNQIGQFLLRRQVDEELQRFRAAMDTSSDMIMLVDRTTMRYVDVNATACELQGYTREEMLRMGPADVSGISREELERSYDAMIADGKTTWQRSTHRRKDGTIVPIEIFRRAVCTDRGWIIAAILRDVSERARAEQLQALEHGIARRLSEAESAADALKGVIRAICESEGWSCGRYFRVDEQARALRFETAWNVPDAAFDEFVARSRDAVYQRGAGIVGRVWETGEPLWSSDLTKDPRALTRRYSLGMGIRSALVFPLTAEGRTIGVLSFSNRQSRDADDGLLRAVHAIGSQVGQFLQRKQAEEELRRFRVAMDTSGELILLIDPAAMRYVDVNDAACRALGYTRAELLAIGPQDVFSKTREELAELYGRMIGGELKDPTVTGVYRRKDGSHLPIEAHPRAVPSSHGHIIVSIARDVSERIAAENRMRDQATQQRLIAEFGQRALAGDDLAEVLDGAAQLVARTLKVEHTNMLQLQPDGLTLLYQAVVGWPRDWIGTRKVPVRPGSRLEHILTRGESLIVEDYTAESEFGPTPLLAYGMRSGMQVPIFGTKGAFGVICVHARKVRRFTSEDVSFLRNIANILAIAIERKNAEDKLAHLAQFDPVTGLPNRYLLRDRLGLALTQASRNDWRGAVLFVDLDRFKAVNDTYGHGVGDKLLIEVAARLKECVRGGDTVARLSGDEFAIVLSSLTKADDAGLVAQKAVTALAAPFNLEGHQTYISASVGIALYPADGADPDPLIKNADTAMYRAKEQGRNCYQFYLPQMNERLMERLQLESKLRGALARGEFRLHYQPKVRLDTGTISGFEALLRWEQDEKLVSPADFIPILEETGLIVSVGEWVLRTVCEQIKAWKDRGIAPRPVAVNLSSRQFQHQYLIVMIEQVLRETGVSPDLIEFELTESLLMSDAEESVQMLHELKSLGVRLSVDDFGTGYSSLSYLRRFPLDTLKIDRAFVSDAVGSPDDATLALTIMNLARSMRLKVVAEGVETEGQVNFLRLHGCDEMQGYYFSRPVEAEECTRMLVEDRRLEKPAIRAGMPALLLVDDSEDDLALLKRALISDDYRILTAKGPTAGFEQLARHGADIVISDYQMPGMSGVEFLTNVRKLYPNTLRVVATGGDDVPTLSSAINHAGIHKFLSKSWDPERLRAEVREAFRQKR